MRRNISICLAITLVATVLLFTSTASVAESKTATQTIRDFYIRYLNYDYRKTPNEKRPTIAITQSFREAVKKNAEICAAYVSGPCGWGANGDEYLDTQEMDPNLNYLNSGIKFEEIERNVVQVKLNVYPSVKDADGYYDKIITYHLANENGDWAVDDVMYQDGESTRKMMAAENANAIANPDPDSPAAKQLIKHRSK